MTTWPYAAGAAALALVAGVVIAGPPSSSDPLVLGPQTAEVSQTEPPLPPASSAPSTSTTTADTASEPPVLVAVPPRDDEPTGELGAVATTTTVAADTTLERSDIDLVVANGARLAGLAGSMSDSLGELGYADIHVGNAIEPADTTVVYFAPGFKDEALRLIADLDLPDARLVELPDSPLLADDSYTAEQVAVVLGRNAIG
jgi:hypothetical protein